ncbi:ABC transporter permease subunit [Bacillus alveayuensis]|uniref:ABC transporter permease subunit n=1 Tax=Aeribacillus alveayuensis TaxID=279215 RepID=UPI00069858FE|nr:ABC transporter permease subunit [Bacillus alveayuensis]
MIRIAKLVLYFLFTIAATLCILCLPFLFTYDKKVSFQPFLYILAIEDTIKQLWNIEKLTFVTKVASPKEYPLFPTILDPYVYSMLLLGGAFTIALFLSIGLSYLYMLVSLRTKKWLKRILFVFEAVPDVMMIIVIQALLIWYFKKTGYMPIEILTFGEEKAFLLPIICLSILPTIQLFRMLILYLEDEQQKPYVEVVKGKGFSLWYITAVHLFRNVFIHLFYHSKTIFLFMLSNLFVLEYIFNINGIMQFLITYGPANTAIGVVIITLLFIPYYLFFLIGSFVVKRVNNQEEKVTA